MTYRDAREILKAKFNKIYLLDYHEGEVEVLKVAIDALDKCIEMEEKDERRTL